MILCECVCVYACVCVCANVFVRACVGMEVKMAGLLAAKNATLSDPKDVLSGEFKTGYATDSKKIQGNLHGLRHIKAVGCHGFQSINPKLLSNFGVNSISLVYKHDINILFD